jgi:hypothetical protein
MEKNVLFGGFIAWGRFSVFEKILGLPLTDTRIPELKKPATYNQLKSFSLP